jgi:hypothetical protein
MYSVNVIRITNNGLTKHIYTFDCRGRHLYYVLYHQSDRSTTQDIWPDEWEEPLSKKKWAEANNITYDEWYDDDLTVNSSSWDIESQYQDYRDSLNPVCCYTTDGRVMGGGMAGYLLSQAHPLPPGVGEEAKAKFIEILTYDA